MSSDITGIGVGLRMDMAQAFLEALPKSVRFIEVHPENYIGRGGRYPAILEAARAHYPVLTHSLTMSFGSPDPFDRGYLADLRAFLHDLEVPWHSDHLCFGGVDGTFVHDLLPLPFSEEAAALVTTRVEEARDALGVPIAVENVSYYAPVAEDALDEARFVREVLERADAKLLLDVNNVFVNSRNFGFDPLVYLDSIPAERVVQIHVAGHLLRPDGLRIDTHGEPICDEVFGLLEHVLRRIGPRPVLLERDNDIPPLEVLLAEVDALTAIYDRATGGRS
ncbi:MAG: DUF692 domain-containing protein [Polyangiaceae bacterium]|nr:DUF692 domain-containing protein [Polyangiaceae bacterium]